MGVLKTACSLLKAEVHGAGEYFRTCFEEDVDVGHGHWREKGFEPATGRLRRGTSAILLLRVSFVWRIPIE